MKKHLFYLLPALFAAGCAQDNMPLEPELGGGEFPKPRP
jgi:hypothetical protein